MPTGDKRMTAKRARKLAKRFRNLPQDTPICDTINAIEAAVWAACIKGQTKVTVMPGWASNAMFCLTDEDQEIVLDNLDNMGYGTSALKCRTATGAMRVVGLEVSWK